VPPPRSDRRLRPLDPSSLHALAIRYVGRFATTRAKLSDYLKRKVAERGWADDNPPPIVAIADRCVESGYVDDQAYAEAKSRSLARRGYGYRRVEAALHHSGIARETTESLRPDDDAAFESAENFARKRRIGRFGPAPADQSLARRQFAAMIRAGHSPELAGYFVRSVPEADNANEI
jgi:regulatory protein